MKKSKTTLKLQVKTLQKPKQAISIYKKPRRSVSKTHNFASNSVPTLSMKLMHIPSIPVVKQNFDDSVLDDLKFQLTPRSRPQLLKAQPRRNLKTPQPSGKHTIKFLTKEKPQMRLRTKLKK